MNIFRSQKLCQQVCVVLDKQLLQLCLLYPQQTGLLLKDFPVKKETALEDTGVLASKQMVNICLDNFYFFFIFLLNY